MKIWFSRRKERSIYHLLMKEFLRMTKQQFCFLVGKVLPLYVLPSYGTIFPVILSVAPVLVPLSHLWKLIYLNNIISNCTFYFIFLLLLPWRALKLLYKAAKQQFSPQTPFCNSTLFKLLVKHFTPLSNHSEVNIKQFLLSSQRQPMPCTEFLQLSFLKCQTGKECDSSQQIWVKTEFPNGIWVIDRKQVVIQQPSNSGSHF